MSSLKKLSQSLARDGAEKGQLVSACVALSHAKRPEQHGEWLRTLSVEQLRERKKIMTEQTK